MSFSCATRVARSARSFSRAATAARRDLISATTFAAARASAARNDTSLMAAAAGWRWQGSKPGPVPNVMRT